MYFRIVKMAEQPTLVIPGDMSMNIVNHITSNKRQDLKIDITPTRMTEGRKHKTCHDIQHRVKRSRVYSPSCNSSDESTIEITWDNNSPSPRRAFSGRRKKSDITSIIKRISKKKNSDLIQKETDESLLTTWKLRNLPFSNSLHVSKPKRLTTRSSIQKTVATKFNDELKRFLEGVNSVGFNAIEDSCMRRSPRLLAMNNKINSSPLALEHVVTNSTVASTNNVLTNGTPYEKQEFSKKRSFCTTPLSSTTCTASTSSTSCRTSINSNICTTPVCPKSEKNKLLSEKQKIPTLSKNSIDFNKTVKSSFDMIDIDLNDGLDAIISSHIECYEHKTNKRNSNNQSENKNDIFTKIKTDIFKKSTECVLDKSEIVSTPKRQLIDFNDLDDFDNLLMSLDDEVRCKSQEVTRLTPSQRVLKARSMTSPFPLNNSVSRHSVQIQEKLTENLNKSIGLDVLSLKSPVHMTPPSSKVLPNKCFSSNVAILTECSLKSDLSFGVPNKHQLSSSNKQNSILPCKPLENATNKFFRQGSVPNNIHSMKNSLPLNLSLIESSGKENYLEDESSDLNLAGSNISVPFMSTQRCSYSEIERKRQEAQIRLKEKLRKRRK
ncbi:uncharacterized protein LOC100206910 isoform X3 [Hydra vulgaris]|uniref:Uncharacterized protein LOC100206910 isoform X3 n=1 Tax=Hydra vulgaris TaxID=6087 RepID=A0ABM4CFZ4_HYDVU